MTERFGLANGTILQGGKYRIVRFLGAGGFGCTYEAEFVYLGVRVAIKEFFPHECCNRDQTGYVSVGISSQAGFVKNLERKFVEEARTLYNLSGLEGVVKVSDVFVENGTSYFVMDYIDGRSLKKVIDVDGPIVEDKAIGIIRQVGRALGSVHSHNCLHLDIKPDNIMIGSDGKPILIDFGVSKQYSEQEGCNTSTLTGSTPGFAPLEQLNGNVKAFTPATDIYALGATLYAMLTGKTPPHASDLLNETVSLDLPSNISDQTRTAVESAMELKVKHRPQRIDAFLSLLPAVEQIDEKEYDTDQTSDVAEAICDVEMMDTDATDNGKVDDLQPSNDFEVYEHESVVSPQYTPDPPTIRKTEYVSKSSSEESRTKSVMYLLAFIVACVISWFGIKILFEGIGGGASSAFSSSVYMEPAMIAALTDKGEYRVYNGADWNNFSESDRSRLYPIGIQLSSADETFVMALNDAGNGRMYKWEDKDRWEDCSDILDLDNVAWRDGKGDKEAKLDFGGLKKADIIMSADGEYSAAKAADGYSLRSVPSEQDVSVEWYLPSAGQLWMIYENKDVIDDLLAKVKGSKLVDAKYWTSTEGDGNSAWCVSMYNGEIVTSIKTIPFRVRAVATVPQ